MANLVDTFRAAGKGLGTMPGVRQVLLLVGLSASIALGVAVVLWAKEPNYRPLFNHVEHSEMASILDSLDRARIRYKLDNGSNMVMVPANQIYKARIKLAASGLPKGNSVGFEMLQQDQGITTSRFMETARYRHALEGELGRTVSHLDGIVDARVHLAIPRQSAFLENDEKPSASVLVNLGGTNALDKSSIAAISRLVASSIPGLESQNVTVVDQTGRLLSVEADNNHFAHTKEQFDHKRQFEHTLEQRVEAIVSPLIGAAKVRAKVTADLDFTHIEQTQENYNQAQPIIRSEEVMSERRGSHALLETEGGVPGAIANAPPGTGVTDKKESSDQSQMREHTTRNYEVGKTISHTLIPSGVLKRLSIAVVVDDKASVGKDGKITTTPLTDAEVQNITALVKNSVGYVEARGDTISVVNSSFAPGKVIEPLPPVPIYEQAWVWQAAKSAAGGIFVLLLLLMVIRPLMRTLSEKRDDDQAKSSDQQQPNMGMYPMAGMPMGAMPIHASGQMPMMQGGISNMAISSQGMSGQASVPGNGWDQVKNLAEQDPKRMAQVMRGWVRD